MTETFRPVHPVHPVRDDEIGTVVALWQRAGMARPWNPPEADIAAIRAKPRSVLLVAGSGGRIVATVAVGDGGHRAWVHCLCADPDRLGYQQSAVMVMQKWLDPERERAFRESPDVQ